MEPACAWRNQAAFPRAAVPPFASATHSSPPLPFLAFSPLLPPSAKPKGFQLCVTASTVARPAHVPKVEEPGEGETGTVEEEEAAAAVRDDRAHDKLIEVFLVDKPNPADWRTLIAFSRVWDDARPHFFRRLEQRAGAEPDPAMRHSLLRLARKLKEIDRDVQRHNELIEVVRSARPEIGKVVARRRKDFTQEFFEHFYAAAHSYTDNPEEGKALLELADECEAAVQAYDNVASSQEALKAAKLKFQEILKSPTAAAAFKKIDELASKNQLDSALVMTIKKAWSNAKETNLTESEVKDIMYQMYLDACNYLKSRIPKEIRIAKYIMMTKDPERRLSLLNDAFTPGEELEGENVDTLYTTPEKLHASVKTLVDAYYHSQPGTIVSEARDLLSPKIIGRLVELQKLIEDEFL